MKARFTALTLHIVLVLALVGCAAKPAADTLTSTVTPTITITPVPATPVPTVPPTPEPTPVPAYMGDFREMTAQQFVKELGPGYADTSLGYYDPTIGYDPYPSIPVWFNLGLGVVAHEEYRYNWSTKLFLGKRVSIAFELKDLPDTPGNLRYNNMDLVGAVQAWQDVPMTIKVENARVELPEQTIELSQRNGIFSVVALESNRYDPVKSWLGAGLGDDNYVSSLPETKTLQKGTFKADVTLLAADGPSKVDYYGDKGMRETKPELTAEWFRFLKSEGFNSIRFQVTWFNHTNDETYEIDQAWLKKVEDTIRLALENDLYVSINLNWDMADQYDTTVMSKEEIEAMPSQHGWLMLDGNPKVEERFAAVWQQIAEYFKDYDEHLIFESINEPVVPPYMLEALNMVGEPHARGFLKIGKAGDNLDRINQIFVDTVRGAGGNNAKRFLFTPSFFHKAAYLSEFQLPQDPAQHVIVAMNYQMGDYAIGGGDPFPNIKKYLIANNIPAVFTEFSSSADDFPYEEREAFMREAVAQARELGIPIIWYGAEWGGVQRGSPGSCLYNPYTHEVAFPELLDILMGRDE